jgi:predicted NUDIX family NTP pyrophosphohydrolase
MPTRSAGLLVWRDASGGPEVLLGHPGGPFFAKKDDGVWSIPKGELDDPDDDPLIVARREFEEETGSPPPNGDVVFLGEVRLRSGKTVVAWAIEGDLDPATAVSNTFEMEWPPRSGRIQPFPEIDRVAWFDLAAARTKLNPAQAAFVDRLEAKLRVTDPEAERGS